MRRAARARWTGEGMSSFEELNKSDDIGWGQVPLSRLFYTLCSLRGRAFEKRVCQSGRRAATGDDINKGTRNTVETLQQKGLARSCAVPSNPAFKQVTCLGKTLGTIWHLAECGIVSWETVQHTRKPTPTTAEPCQANAAEGEEPGHLVEFFFFQREREGGRIGDVVRHRVRRTYSLNIPAGGIPRLTSALCHMVFL